MSTVRILKWHCPVCDLGDEGVDSRCLHCHGTGFTNDITGFKAEARRAPRPPAVRPRPCVDCAFRKGSLEREHDADFDRVRTTERPFFCHQGMPMVNGAYQPTAYLDEFPLGAMVCRGWWDWATTGALPSAPYREVVDPE
ncbi:hypothetical protein IL38_23695 [Actinopolyspora erythraea]|uniref:RanBP2-type domain-containing protein n=1 Tax=Actinopolyspora erythraea TaxID=414996 RepID=A0ABR4WYE1_9ACTN|nr:hypothetical protein [Actinopolyspora erythraea]KGI79317.1 hypothetical protein IL38_23695 [Actinopolyspora erythraea]